MTYAQCRAIMILSGQPPIDIVIAPFVGGEPVLKDMAGKRKQIAQIESRNRVMRDEKLRAICLLSSQWPRKQNPRPRRGD